MRKLLFLLFPFVYFLGMTMSVTSPVMAEELDKSSTSSYLYGTCMDVVYQDDTLTTSVYCKAFIQGVVKTLKYYSTYYKFSNQYCLPRVVSESEVIRIFMKFVEGNPGFLKKPAITTLHYALENSFPCTESQLSK